MSSTRVRASRSARLLGGVQPMLYRRLASPLHATRAGIAALWALALSFAVLLLYHPLALAAVAIAILLAAGCAGIGSELLRSLRTALIVALPIVTINVLVARDGLTVFARLGSLGPFGQGDLTVEALVYGAVIALKVTDLILITALASLTIDPDALLRNCRRFSFRAALTASLAIRMVPLLAADTHRLAEAQRTRPDTQRDDPRTRRGTRRRLTTARDRAALIGAVLTGSLDRAMDVAATLEVRGFAATPSRGHRSARHRSARSYHASRPHWSRHDLAFAASAFAVAALSILGRLTGAASFTAYPLVHLAWGAPTALLCAAVLLAVLIPFSDRRGIEP